MCPGHLSLTLLGKSGVPVQISVDGRRIFSVAPAAERDMVWRSAGAGGR